LAAALLDEGSYLLALLEVTISLEADDGEGLA
jgi:hypothetical protein